VERVSKLKFEKSRISFALQNSVKKSIAYLNDFSNLIRLIYLLFLPSLSMLAIFIMRQSGGVDSGERGLSTLEIFINIAVWCTIGQSVLLCWVGILCVEKSHLLTENQKLKLLIAAVVIAIVLSQIFQLFPR
jgi:hypothetical protein